MKMLVVGLLMVVFYQLFVGARALSRGDEKGMVKALTRRILWALLVMGLVLLGSLWGIHPHGL